MKKIISSFFSLLAIASLNSFAETSQFECPTTDRITVLNHQVPAIVWVAPKLTSSARFGMGYGGNTVGPFIGSTAIDDLSGWICIYGSEVHSTFTHLNQHELSTLVPKTLNDHSSEIMKKLPNNFNYGFLYYQKL